MFFFIYSIFLYLVYNYNIIYCILFILYIIGAWNDRSMKQVEKLEKIEMDKLHLDIIDISEVR